MTPPSPAGERECDLIMKGGITSGVVYPRAVVELAKEYRLRCVGGSSAGAIAAAAAAAAEYGRQSGAPGAGRGFDGLARLPEELAAILPTGETRLRSLFQPSRRTREVLDVIVEALPGAGALGKVRRAALAILLRPPGLWILLAGIAIVGSLVAAATRAEADVAVALALSSAAWIVLLPLAAGGVFVLRACSAVRANGFGICSGFASPGRALADEVEPLTAWLDRLLRRLAGVSHPLTLGDLESRGVELAVTTTSLTNMRPFRLPFHPDDPQLFFREDEFRGLFPGDVVDALVQAGEAELAAPAERPRQRERAAQAALAAGADAAPRGRLVPFPRGPGLPVVVVARMSLSFPLLVSAVPLWGVDWTRKENQGGRAPKLERVWFSDGGICSNMPLHFFDAALPTRPTFAIDLRDAHPDHAVGAWLPKNNASGTAQRWTRLPEGGSGVLAFLAAIVTTMQTWVDETLLVTPGFRDRTAHVSHTHEEGGLNLDMRPDAIGALARRGAEAGVLLRDRFSWENHLWVRFRTLANVLERLVGPASRAYGPGTERRAELLALLEGHTGAGSYRVTGAQAAAVRTTLAHLDALVADVRANGADLQSGAPRPTPELRVRPRF